MRENNRKPIEKCRKKLPQFTTMNVIDGQAGLVIYSSLIFYSLTIDNILNIIVNIIVLLILAGVTISTLTGDNGIIAKANEAKTNTEIAGEKEAIEIAYSGVMAKNRGNGVSASELEIELRNNGYDSTVSGTDPITVKFNDSLREYTIDSNGNINGGNGEEETSKTVEDLVAGEKVYYDTGNTSIGEEGIIECIVLYDTKYNEENGTDYGVQITPKDILRKQGILPEEVSISGKEDYNDALKILHETAQNYLNTTYASSARCIGSNPANPDWDAISDQEGNPVNEAGYYTKQIAEEQGKYQNYMESYYGTLKNEDEQYETDLEQMNSINIAGTLSSYWLASRQIESSSETNSFKIRLMNEGELSAMDLFNVYSAGHTFDNGYTSAIRPVFTLKSEIKVTGGDGVDTPYTLES